MTGGALLEICRLDWSERDPRLDKVELLVACDVDSPLLGPHGATAVYARQKGATELQLPLLEQGLAHWAALTNRADAEQAGAGAAGGLGFGLAMLAGARLVSGIKLVSKLVRFDHRLQGCDLVLTGEGQLDTQSLRGKVVGGVARKARERGVPAVAIVGRAANGSAELLEAGLTAYYSLQDGAVSKELALAEAPQRVAELAAQVVQQHRP